LVTAIVAVVVVALCLALVIAVARDPGPPAGEVALAYELAWDRLDFDTLWTLSGEELRDGRSKRDFVASKQAAYRQAPDLGGLALHVSVEDVVSGSDVAEARTRVELRGGGVVRNELRLAHRDGKWQVVAYELEPDSRSRPAH
jgi:hypothetical protein